MRRLRDIGLCGLLLLLATACSENQRGELPVPPGKVLENVEQIELGQKLFAAHCAECHGGLTEGRTQRAARFNPGAPDFHEVRYQTALPGYLFLRIEQGNRLEPFHSEGSVMPAWGPYLNSGQIWGLVAYIRYRAGNVSLSELDNNSLSK
jgi:mono/diheme cytochrome c family protein